MELDKNIRRLLTLEAALMAGLLTSLYLMSPFEADYFYLYELFGALSAGIITTFGIYKMRQLT